MTAHVGKVSQLVRLSRQQWHQKAGTAEQLSLSVQRAVVKRANQAFLAQPSPTPPTVQPAAGLLNVDDIVDSGEVADNLDALVDLDAQIRANGGSPSHVVVDPLGWAALRKIKTDSSGSAQSLVGAGTTDALPMLL